MSISLKTVNSEVARAHARIDALGDVTYATVNYNVRHSNKTDILSSSKNDAKVRITVPGLYYVFGSGFAHYSTNQRFVIWCNNTAAFSSRNGDSQGDNIVVAGVIRLNAGDVVRFACPANGTEFNYVVLKLGA